MAVTTIRQAQIVDGAINDAKVQAAAAIATSKLADGANFIQRGGSVAFTADQSHGGFKITSLGTPTADGDAATKAYVDSLANGVDWKGSVRVASTGNLVLSGLQTIDTISVIAANRVLAKDQTTGAENGIYVCATGAWTRATDADVSAEVTAGMAVFVEEGTQADTGWVLTTDNPITLGTTALVFTQFTGLGTITAGAGMTKTGNTINVITADTSLTVGVDNMNVNLGDASLEVSSGLRVKHGTSGQVYIASATGVLTPVTMSGDATIIADGTLTTASGVAKIANKITRETPTGTINGANVTFTLANTPVAGTEEVFLNGILQESGAGNDYTISGLTITYLTAPLTGDRLKVCYWK